jgi:hypothetical protein
MADSDVVRYAPSDMIVPPAAVTTIPEHRQFIKNYYPVPVLSLISDTLAIDST